MWSILCWWQNHTKKLQEKKHDRTVSLVNTDTVILSKIPANQIWRNISKLNMGGFRKIKHNDHYVIHTGYPRNVNTVYYYITNKKRKDSDVSIIDKIIW